MTRDQVSALCRLKGRKFVLVDTGGFFDFEEDPLSSQIKKKAREAAENSDILIFVLDGKRELLPAEEELYFSLKKLNRPIFVVVNKIDSPSEEAKLGDYYRLGEEKVLAVSAEHKRNLEHLESSLITALPALVPEKEETKALKIAIIGRINVGKSSIVNRLCGEEKLIVSEIPGTTRDSTDTLILRNEKAFCLVDTAGIRKLSRTRDKREKASIIKAKKDITRADVICMIMDAQEFPTRQDSAVAHLSQMSGKPMLIALNKWDLIQKNTDTSKDFWDLIQKNTDTSKDFEQKVYEKLDFVNYAPLLFISAISGKRVIKILDIAEQVYVNGHKKIETSRLNNYLSWINENHPPLSKNKRRMKIDSPPDFFPVHSFKSSPCPCLRAVFQAPAA
jgi:GTP-binding protein